MSRPPIQRTVPSPRGTAETGYFGADFNALVALAETVAREGHGVEIPAKGRGLARTMIELPALLAHVLGEHQSLYAREAHLGSAKLTDNLTRHARMLAYSPDPGVAAVGLAAFTVKAGLSGTLPKGFALQSSPLGVAKAETYETLAEARVDAEWNSIRPIDAEVFNPVSTDHDRIEIGVARRHGLEPGEIVLLTGRGRVGVFRVVDAFDGARPPRIALHNIGGHNFSDAGTAADWTNGYRLLARPEIEARLFGWSANAALWPPASLASASVYTAPETSQGVGTLTFGYAAPVPPGTALMLAETVVPPAPKTHVAVVSPALATPYMLASVGEEAVSFVRGEVTEEPVITTSGSPPVVIVTMVATVVETRLAARATVLALLNLGDGTPKAWTTFPLDARVLADWSNEIALTPTIPNRARIGPEFAVTADLSAMHPGRPVIVRRLSSGEVREATVAAVKAPGAGPAWSMSLEMTGGFPTDWSIGDVEVQGNVVRVSHGETKSEILGSSDGVTPHQAFEVRKAPVTRLPGALGAEMALQVRVDGVLWDAVQDFNGQGPEARIHTEETAADGKVTVRFGGEGRGAIPPAGKRNVGAEYRQGLGTRGNAGPGRVSRMKKSSPFIDSVINPLALAGGADPAGPIDIARQAVRPVKVFDRAVSVEDHADLALLFPSIARAAARWLDAGAIELVAADVDGNGPADLAALTAFLDARRDIGLPLVIVAPQAVEVIVGLRVERDRAWLADAVHQAVEEALLGGAARLGLFTFTGRELSAPQSLSGLYAVLLSLPGIVAVDVVEFRLAAQRLPGAGPQVADLIHASLRQWLRLSPSSLDIQIVEPGLLDRARTA